MKSLMTKICQNMLGTNIRYVVRSSEQFVMLTNLVPQFAKLEQIHIRNVSSASNDYMRNFVDRLQLAPTVNWIEFQAGVSDEQKEAMGPSLERWEASGGRVQFWEQETTEGVAMVLEELGDVLNHIPAETGPYWKDSRLHLSTKLAWPTAEDVDAANRGKNHLLLGISSIAARDFLLASGCPRNWGRRNGYTLVEHIRRFMRVKGYERFSVVEVLRAAKHPHCGKAQLFLSHAQSERAEQTFDTMFQAAGSYGPMFVDYFCLRQCVGSMDPARVLDAIREIGFTVAGLAHSGDGSAPMLQRVWRGYEIYCTIATGARFWAVAEPAVDRALCSKQQILDFDLRACRSQKPEDKSTLMEFFDDLEGGVQAANKAVSEALLVARRSRAKQNAFGGCTICLSCFGFCVLPPALIALVVCLVLEGWGLGATISLAVAIGSCLLLLLLVALGVQNTGVGKNDGVQLHRPRTRSASVEMRATGSVLELPTPSSPEAGDGQPRVARGRPSTEPSQSLSSRQHLLD